MNLAPLKIVVKHLVDLGYDVTIPAPLEKDTPVTFRRVREGELRFNIYDSDGNVVGEAVR